MKYKNRLFELRGNLSQKEFAERIGLSQQNYANYENGKQGLKSDLIAKICETFGCSAEWLLELDNVATAPIPGARRAVPAPTVKVPVLGRVHAGPAGDPDVFDEEIREAEILATYFERDPEVHVLDYEGDCMNRVFGEGTTSLVVSPNSPFGNGDIVVAVIDGTEYVVRRLEQTARELRLKPCSWNPEHVDIVVSRDDGREVEFKGKVLECFKRFE